jgi:hypothetical protein
MDEDLKESIGISLVIFGITITPIFTKLTELGELNIVYSSLIVSVIISVPFIYITSFLVNSKNQYKKETFSKSVVLSDSRKIFIFNEERDLLPKLIFVLPFELEYYKIEKFDVYIILVFIGFIIYSGSPLLGSDFNFLFYVSSSSLIILSLTLIYFTIVSTSYFVKNNYISLSVNRTVTDYINIESVDSMENQSGKLFIKYQDEEIEVISKNIERTRNRIVSEKL